MSKLLLKSEMLIVPIDVAERAMNACKKTNRDLLKIKRYSNHPDDISLYTVLAVKTKGDFKEYVTWIYNDSTKGLGTGHYMETDDLSVVDEEYNSRNFYVDEIK